jgi:hypothetical protein
MLRAQQLKLQKRPTRAQVVSERLGALRLAFQCHIAEDAAQLRRVAERIAAARERLLRRGAVAAGSAALFVDVPVVGFSPTEDDERTLPLAPEAGPRHYRAAELGLPSLDQVLRAAAALDADCRAALVAYDAPARTHALAGAHGPRLVGGALAQNLLDNHGRPASDALREGFDPMLGFEWRSCDRCYETAPPHTQTPDEAEAERVRCAATRLVGEADPKLGAVSEDDDDDAHHPGSPRYRGLSPSYMPRSPLPSSMMYEPPYSATSPLYLPTSPSIVSLPPPLAPPPPQAQQTQTQQQMKKSEEERAPVRASAYTSASRETCPCDSCVAARRRRALLLVANAPTMREEKPNTPKRQAKKQWRAAEDEQENAFLRRALRLHRRYQTANDGRRRDALVHAFADDRDSSSEDSSSDDSQDQDQQTEKDA